MNTLLPERPEYLMPAGAELMRDTPIIPLNVGGIACLGCHEAGMSDSDNTGTTMSGDPETLDPRP